MSKHIYFVLNDRNVNIDQIVSTGYEKTAPMYNHGFGDKEEVYSVRLVNGDVIYIEKEERISDLERCLGIS